MGDRRDLGPSRWELAALASIVTPVSAGTIIAGLILLIVGFVLGYSILWLAGFALFIAGAVLLMFGVTNHRIGPRAHYW